MGDKLLEKCTGFFILVFGSINIWLIWFYLVVQQTLMESRFIQGHKIMSLVMSGNFGGLAENDAKRILHIL